MYQSERNENGRGVVVWCTRTLHAYNICIIAHIHLNAIEIIYEYRRRGRGRGTGKRDHLIWIYISKLKVKHIIRRCRRRFIKRVDPKHFQLNGRLFDVWKITFYPFQRMIKSAECLFGSVIFGRSQNDPERIAF